jgi:hypothetical protein
MWVILVRTLLGIDLLVALVVVYFFVIGLPTDRCRRST